METLASLCKRRGFIFQSSEIYGGINGFWDYGPLGCELKRNVREAWWHDVVQVREDVVGLDASIIMHPRVWEASGHVGGFSDPMVDCKSCKKRYKGDQFCEDQGKTLIVNDGSFELPEGVKCPSCGSSDLTEPRAFDLMFRTYVGPVEDDSSKTYLRPETAQGIFVQFANVLAVSRAKIPFGIAQMGKAFRNEINPRNYQSIGLPAESLGKHVYPQEELAHYASACVDVTYAFPFGVQELEGIAARGDFDLSRHQEHSGKSMQYFDQAENCKYLPHVVEPSAGTDRITLALLCNAYCEEWVPKGGGQPLQAEPGKQPPEGHEARTVMKFHPRIAPIKVAVFPLLKNRPELVEKARMVFDKLQGHWPCFWDQVGAIGRRYRRQDEVGTPFCITVDFETLETDTVTVRDRDTMQQSRVSIPELVPLLSESLPR